MKLSKNIQFLRSRMYLLGGILIVAAIILLVLLNRSTLNVAFAPDNSVVTLDNAPLNTLPNGTANVTTKPGQHVLKVEADGFVSQIFNLDLRGGRSKSVKVKLIEIPKPLDLKLNDASISANAVVTGDEDGSLFLLGNDSSAIYKIKFNPDTSIQTLSQITNPGLSGIADIIWGPKKDAVIFKKGNSASFLDFQKFNFVSQQEIKYGDDIGDIAWAPDDSKIAYYYAPAGGEQSLIFAGRSNSDMIRVVNFKDWNITDPYLAWSGSSQWLLIVPRNTDKNTNKIYLFDTYTRTMKAVTETGNNIGASFSPDGSKIIFSSVSDDPANPVKSELSVMNSDGTNVRDLKVKAEISKIAWIDNSNIAVATYDPKTQNESLFKYNIDSKSVADFSIPLAGLYVKEIIMGSDNKTLYFIANNGLYQVAL